MIRGMSAFRNVEQQIDLALGPDRHKLRRQLNALRQASREGRPFDRNLARLTADLERSMARRRQRQERIPALTFDEDLPIAHKREEIAAAIAQHPVVVICGETGSGKSTQLPKICLQLGRGVDGLIGHTQPRRIAARSVAARIADELHSPLGQAVGFKVRFTDTTSPDTFIKLMTDGILLAESQHDRFLNQYDTIILDEAHERSLNIDFLVGYLKRLLLRRRDLKLIITSATIDAERFSEHFATVAGPAPIVLVSGRTYPVDIRYRPVGDDEADEDPDWQQGVLDAVDELARLAPGDMLIFMPTERDIHETANLLRRHAIPGDLPGRTTEILPLYARLSANEQNRVFQPHPWRRIVIATNVAESSLTVPGIRYVIDPGMARISRYAARSKVQRLPIEAISQASANQRAGRCGRVGPGVCIRLFSEADYQQRERFTPPEIQRTNLAAVILQTKSLGFGRIEDFPFLDPPRTDAIRDGYNTLFELGAIDARQELTELGKRLSRIPVDPRIGRIILAGHDENCLNEVLIIAAALESQNPRERPIDKQQAADTCHEQFTHAESDFLGELKLWDFYHRLKRTVSRSQLRKACRQNFLSENRLREWNDLHQQLLETVEQSGLKQRPRRDEFTPIHRALLTGFLSSIANRPESLEYTVAGGQKVFLWPGSAIFESKPKWVVGAELVETSKRYLRTAARIDPAWIEPIAAHLVTRTCSDPFWDRDSGSVKAFEKVTLSGLVLVARRRIAFGPRDPVKAREMFLQHALVEGDFETRGSFLEANRKLIEEIETLQEKSRRPGMLRGEEARFDFYERRVPADVYDGARFEKWRRAAERTAPKLLYMTRGDLVDEQTQQVAAADFPETMTMQQMKLPLAYCFDPGSAQDGITLTVPVEGLNQLDPHRLGWLVPGLLEEKIVALIRSLPKAIRVGFVPASDTARRVLGQLRFGSGSFTEAVAAALSSIGGETISAASFQEQNLPDHLRMNVQVVDDRGKPLAAGRELAAIRQKLGAEAAASFAALDDPRWHRDGIVQWDFGELPATVNVRRGGITLTGYPTLIDAGTAVSLRLLDSPQKSALEMRAGLRRLFALTARREMKAQVDWLPNMNQHLLYAGALPGANGFKQQIASLLADRAFLADSEVPRNLAEFERQAAAGHQRIGLAVQDLTGLLDALMPVLNQTRGLVARSPRPQCQAAVADLRSQFEHLTPAGFLTAVPWGWLLQYPRYLRAMQIRLEKLAAGGLARDGRHAAEIAPAWHACLERQCAHRERDIYDPSLVYYRWMIEEFRVSLFAQELGTAIPISKKRLEEQWTRVRQ